MEREASALVTGADGDPEPWRYLYYEPRDAGEGEAGKPLPLMIYLHGRSARGDDFGKVRRYGPPSFLDERPDFPFITVSPQLPDGSWNPDELDPLLDEWLERHPVDPDRVYLTGVSLGAMGAWTWAAASPERFAALVPIGAHGPGFAAKRLLNLPIRAYHGDADKIVPIDPHLALIEAIREQGGDAEIEAIPGGTHGNIIVPMYRREGLYEWMSRQTRSGGTSSRTP